MINVNRRDFLKGSVALGVAGALSGTVLNTLRPSTAYAEEATSAWTPTMCAGCTTWCSVEVKTQIDTGITRAVDIRGNSASKRGDQSIGDKNIVCPKARIALQEAYDADRVKVPMRRTNNSKGRGVDPEFVPVSWDYALNEIADKMVDMRNATPSRSHQYTYLRGRYSYGRATMYDAVKSIYGTKNSISHSATCAEAENFARSVIVGEWGYDDYDLDNTKYLLLWGVDPLSSNRMIPGSINKLGYRMKNDDITVVSIDPRLHATGAKAHKWLPVKPGTDGALALAMAHHILANGLYNTDFVGSFGNFSGTGMAAAIAADSVGELGTKGVGEWWDTELVNCTPAWAAAITGIDADTIEEVAEGFAANGVIADMEYSCSWCGPGPTMQPNGVYGGWAIMALNGLVGSFDHLGGDLVKEPAMSYYSSSAPSGYSSAPYVASHSFEKQKITKYITSGVELDLPSIKTGSGPGGGTPTNRAADAIRDGSPYETKFVIGIMSNFVFSCVGTKRWEDAYTTGNAYNTGDMSNWSAISDDTAPPFVVDCTTHASEYSMFADYVLPAKHLGLECKSSAHQNASGRHRVHGLYNAVIDPVWPDAKNPESEFAWMLGKAFKAKDATFTHLIDYLSTAYAYAYTDGIGPLLESSSSEHFEDYQHRYHATKGDRQLLWTQINAPYTESGIIGATGAGNGIAQSTYISGLSEASNYFDDDGRGDAWWYAVTGSGAENFATASKKVEFYSSTSKLAGDLDAHASNHSTTIAGIMAACNYNLTASEITGGKGDMYALMPHWEDPHIAGDGDDEYPYTFIDHKSRLNREGRSANAPWYHEFKSCDAGDEKWSDVIKIHPIDADAIGVVDGDEVEVTSPDNVVDGITYSAAAVTCKAKVWQGVRPGTVAKSYGQGHWAYGRYASRVFGSTPNGGNNNEILPTQYERLSGSIARNAVTRVKIVKKVV